jgi:hypothetical protein
MWMIRAGRGGEQVDEFIERNRPGWGACLNTQASDLGPA